MQVFTVLNFCPELNLNSQPHFEKAMDILAQCVLLTLMQGDTLCHFSAKSFMSLRVWKVESACRKYEKETIIN